MSIQDEMLAELNEILGDDDVLLDKFSEFVITITMALANHEDRLRALENKDE